MFGFNALELSIFLGILLFLAAITKKRPSAQGVQRKCLVCGHEGSMQTWLQGYTKAQLILIILLFLWVIPGLLFLIWAWGKRKCPKCGALDKSMAL